MLIVIVFKVFPKPINQDRSDNYHSEVHDCQNKYKTEKEVKK